MGRRGRVDADGPLVGARGGVLDLWRGLSGFDISAAARGGPSVGSLRRRRVRDASGHTADANHRRFVWLWEPSHLVEIEAVTSHQV